MDIYENPNLFGAIDDAMTNEVEIIENKNVDAIFNTKKEQAKISNLIFLHFTKKFNSAIYVHQSVTDCDDLTIDEIISRGEPITSNNRRLIFNNLSYLINCIIRGLEINECEDTIIDIYVNSEFIEVVKNSENSMIENQLMLKFRDSIYHDGVLHKISNIIDIDGEIDRLKKLIFDENHFSLIIDKKIYTINYSNLLIDFSEMIYSEISTLLKG